jgi:hypothetical protein
VRAVCGAKPLRSQQCVGVLADDGWDEEGERQLDRIGGQAITRKKQVSVKCPGGKTISERKALIEECLRDLAARAKSSTREGSGAAAHGRTPNRLVHARTPTTPQASLKQWHRGLRAKREGEGQAALSVPAPLRRYRHCTATTPAMPVSRMLVRGAAAEATPGSGSQSR